jgi:hypothetical protein
MRIHQNDLMHFISNVANAAMTQAQHMLCVLAAVFLTHTGLSDKEGLEPFFLQALDDLNRWNVRVPF